VEYACSVRVNGTDVGLLAWPPWTLDIPPSGNASKLTLEVTVANTLANLLTSRHVSDWTKRRGKGWLGPFHVGCQRLETETTGGGLFGPVRILASSKDI